jgi:hypothetical protein
MLNDVMGTHITHRIAILAETIGAGRNFVSNGDLHVHGRLQNHTKSVPVVPGKSSVYP